MIVKSWEFYDQPSKLTNYASISSLQAMIVKSWEFYDQPSKLTKYASIYKSIFTSSNQQLHNAAKSGINDNKSNYTKQRESLKQRRLYSRCNAFILNFMQQPEDNLKGHRNVNRKELDDKLIKKMLVSVAE